MRPLGFSQLTLPLSVLLPSLRGLRRTPIPLSSVSSEAGSWQGGSKVEWLKCRAQSLGKAASQFSPGAGPADQPPFILAAALCRGDVISPILQVKILRPGKQVIFWQNSESVS